MMKKAVLVIFMVVLAAFLAGCQKQEKPITTPGGDADIPSDMIKNTMEENGPPSDLKEGTMQEGKPVMLSIKNFAFEPAELKIKKGTTVKWQNFDSAPHDVTSTTGKELGSATLSANDAYEHAFNEPGTFEYYCSIHPRMKAKVIVE